MIDIGSGFIKAVSNGATTVKNGAKKAWKYILLDACIVGLIALFAVAPVDFPHFDDLYTMVKAFFIALVFEVGVERGLKKNVGE